MERFGIYARESEPFRLTTSRKFLRTLLGRGVGALVFSHFLPQFRLVCRPQAAAGDAGGSDLRAELDCGLLKAAQRHGGHLGLTWPPHRLVLISPLNQHFLLGA